MTPSILLPTQNKNTDHSFPLLESTKCSFNSLAPTPKLSLMARRKSSASSTGRAEIPENIKNLKLDDLDSVIDDTINHQIIPPSIKYGNGNEGDVDGGVESRKDCKFRLPTPYPKKEEWLEEGEDAAGK